VAIGSGSYLVDLSHLGNGADPLNLAKSYSHPGVAAHPSDRGMDGIAKALFTASRGILRSGR